MNATADHHLPQFHLRLPRGYLNDPNGPIDLDGRAHLYFQSRPRVDLDIPVEWGHASSDDLVHWTLHRPAIVPVPGGADSGGAWSGNTVRHEGKVRAYYSGKVDHSPYQSVLMAESLDGGATYGEPVQVVEDPSPEEGVTMFRDPFVWQDGSGWSMGVGSAAVGAKASIRHYRSTDGLLWRHVGDLAALERTHIDGVDTGQGWECPQILTVDGVDVAIVASWSHADGPSDVLAFTVPDTMPDITASIRSGGAHPQKVDEGQNFYAASVMRNSSWGPVLFGWITEGRSTQWSQQAGWSGAISLPRRTWLDAGRLACEPHPALDALRVGTARPAHEAVIGAQAEVLLAVPSTGRIRLRFSPREYLDIVSDVEAGTMAVDRTNASADDRAHGGRVVVHEAFEAAAASDAAAARPAVRVLIDGSVVEVFTSGGRAVTTRVYPTQAPPWTLEAPAQAVVWPLRAAITTEASVRAATPTGRVDDQAADHLRPLSVQPDPRSGVRHGLAVAEGGQLTTHLGGGAGIGSPSRSSVNSVVASGGGRRIDE